MYNTGKAFSWKAVLHTGMLPRNEWKYYLDPLKFWLHSCCCTKNPYSAIYMLLHTLLTHSQTDLMRSSGQTATGDTEQLSQSSSSGSGQQAPTRLWGIMAAALFRPENSAFPLFCRPLLCPGDLRRDVLADEGRHRSRGLRAEGTRGEGGHQRRLHSRERGRAKSAQILVKILWPPEGETRWSEILCWGLESTCHCLHL